MVMKWLNMRNWFKPPKVEVKAATDFSPLSREERVMLMILMGQRDARAVLSDAITVYIEAYILAYYKDQEAATAMQKGAAINFHLQLSVLGIVESVEVKVNI